MVRSENRKMRNFPKKRVETQASGEFSGWVRRGKKEQHRYRENTPEKQYLLVDGYNIIFALGGSSGTGEGEY